MFSRNEKPPHFKLSNQIVKHNIEKKNINDAHIDTHVEEVSKNQKKKHTTLLKKNASIS